MVHTALVLEEEFGLVAQVGISGELVFELMSQLVEELGIGHLG